MAHNEDLARTKRKRGAVRRTASDFCIGRAGGNAGIEGDGRKNPRAEKSNRREGFAQECPKASPTLPALACQPNSPFTTSPPSTILIGRPSGEMFSVFGSTFKE